MNDSVTPTKSKITYTEVEYNELVDQNKILKEKLENLHKLCQHICSDANKSSWYIKTPKDMANHLSYMIKHALWRIEIDSEYNPGWIKQLLRNYGKTPLDH